MNFHIEVQEAINQSQQQNKPVEKKESSKPSNIENKNTIAENSTEGYYDAW
ncbi:hypothetical protein Metvu_1030 [Methanocaldococcus vulcanius M7]|uniref:Uncharacterized protein n=1 Tax=Methanocaldococcus vulcanius (strain ATCC 700851 / DSM 12094 / M7) TaxID=579137 RepID=C9RH36_METVM|nr:hypothetical protein [Methanocaldococcus vulcanius]ACX72888.1 hypothetical protein Metvu_1030 [Methanocaldococcus vulcanius M7]